MILNETIVGGGKLIESLEKLPNRVLCRVQYPICNIGKINANKRIYGRDVWETLMENKSIVSSMKERSLFGHAEHPEGTQSKTPEISHVVTKLWVDEGRAYQEYDILDTPQGRIVDCLLEAGCNLGVSTRAEGDLREDTDDDGGKCYHVIAESYKYITTDFTADPSTFGVLPIGIKRNVVSKIRKEVENVEAKPEEKKFATRLLESMVCKDKSKCQKCGCCDIKVNEDQISDIIAYEGGDLPEADTLKLFAELIKSGLVWKLQGSYGRVAQNLIDAGKIGKDGEIIESKKTNEGQVTVVADGTDGRVAVSGNVETIVVDPLINTKAPGGSVDVTVFPKGQQTATVTITKAETVPQPSPADGTLPVDGTQADAKEEDGDISDEDIELSDEDFEEEVDLDKESVEESKINEEKIRYAAMAYDSRIEAYERYGVYDTKDEADNHVERLKKSLNGKIFTDIKVFPVKNVNDPAVEESIKVNECKDVKALYTKKGLKAPKGKGTHTKAFHKCVTNYAGKIKSGKMTKKDAYKRCMGGLGKKNAVKKSHQRNESIIHVVDYINELLNEKRGPWGEKINEMLYDKGYNVNDDQIAEIVDKISDNMEDWDKLISLLSGEDAEAVVKFLQEKGLKLNKVEESKINEEKDLIFVDETYFKNDKFGVYRKPVGASSYLLFGFPTEDKAITMAHTVADALGSEFSETAPEGFKFDESRINEGVVITINTENAAFAPDANVEIARILKRLSDEVSSSNWMFTKNLRDVNGNKVGTYQLTEARVKTPSVLNKEITELQIKEAVARAERDVAVESLDASFNKDLEVKILTKKLKESKVGDSDESLALRSKLEEKTKAAKDWMAKAAVCSAQIDKLEKELNDAKTEASIIATELEKQVIELKKERAADAATMEKMKKDNMEGAERRDKANEEKASLVKEYVSKQLNEGFKVSDDNRALLESCQTIDAVDKALDECRDLMRRRALHTKPLEKVILEKLEKTVDPIVNRQRTIINNVLKPRA